MAETSVRQFASARRPRELGRRRLDPGILRPQSLAAASVTELEARRLVKPVGTRAQSPMGGQSPAVGTAALLLVAGGAEAMLALAFVGGSMALGQALAVHAGIALTLWWSGAFLRTGEASHHPVSLLFVVTTVALGPIGPAGTLLTLLVWKSLPRGKSGRLVVDPATPAADTSLGQPDLLERIERGEGDALDGVSVTSFSDVLSGGRFEEKQEMITLIANTFRPSFAPALLGALNDPEPAIRVQAATAVARIERSFNKAAMALEEPTGVDQDVSRLLELARHHDRYAESGLLDGARTRTARLAALSIYEEVRRRGDGSLSLDHAIVRLLVRLGRPEDALKAFEACAADGRANSVAMHLWKIESLYILGRFDEVRHACRDLPDLEGSANLIPEVCREVIALWADGEASS